MGPLAAEAMTQGALRSCPRPIGVRERRSCDRLCFVELAELFGVPPLGLSGQLGPPRVSPSKAGGP